jgi:hypothetical protein
MSQKNYAERLRDLSAKSTIKAFVDNGKPLLTQDDVFQTASNLNLDPQYSYVVIQAFCDKVVWNKEGVIRKAPKSSNKRRKLQSTGIWSIGYQLPRIGIHN